MKLAASSLESPLGENVSYAQSMEILLDKTGADDRHFGNMTENPGKVP